MKIRNSRVLITGGADLIGSHIFDQLVREGAAEILIIDDFSRGMRENLARASDNGPGRVIEGDINDRDDVFNVTRAEETSLKDLAKTLLKVMISDLGLEYGPERKVNPVTRRMADISKAKKMLGFEPTISLEDGLRSLVEWRRQRRPFPET